MEDTEKLKVYSPSSSTYHAHKGYVENKNTVESIISESPECKRKKVFVSRTQTGSKACPQSMEFQPNGESSRRMSRYNDFKPDLIQNSLPGPPYKFLYSSYIIKILKSIKDFSKILPCVPDGLKENKYFLVSDNVDSRKYKGGKDTFKDDSGPWDFSRSNAVTHYFIFSSGKSVDLKEGKYCRESKKDNMRIYIPLDPQPDPSSVISLRSYYVRHQSSESYRRRITWICNVSKDIPSIAFYEYCGFAPKCLKEVLGVLSTDVYDNCVSLSFDDPSLLSFQGNSSAMMASIGDFEQELLAEDTKNTFLQLHEILDMLKLEASSKRTLAHVPRGLKENQYFVVNNSLNVERHRKGRKCTFWDDSGPWTSHAVATFSYLYGPNKILKKVTNQNGEYCIEHKVDGEKGFIPLVPQPDQDTLILFHRSSAKHKESTLYKRRITWLEGGSEALSHVACYEYCGTAPQSLRESLHKVAESWEASTSSLGDDCISSDSSGIIVPRPDCRIRCANGGFMLTHPDGKFLDLYEVISVLQMNGINDKPLDSVPSGVKENQFFIVDNSANIERQEKGKKNVFWDDCGAWNAKCTRVNTEKYLCGPDQKLTRVLYLQGEFCIERHKDNKRMYIPLSPQPDPNNLLVIHRNFSKHSLSSNYQRKVTWLENFGEKFPAVACYEYLGKFPGHRPHGSCTKNIKDYVRTKESTIVKVKEEVKSMKPSDAYQKLSDESISVNDDPRTVIKSRHYQYVERRKVENSIMEVNDVVKAEDSIMDVKDVVEPCANLCANLWHMVNTHPFVQEVISTKGRQMSFVMFANEQILDIKRFCCYSGTTDTTILGFSKIHDVGGLTLTVSMFKNLAVTRSSSRQHPIFPGPMFLHEKTDFQTYARFFSHLSYELGDDFSQLIVGCEDEEMQKAFDMCFPNGLSFSSIQYIQKDIMNYLKDQGGIPAKNGNRIEESIFGNDGIVHAKDFVTFSDQVNKTQRLCDELAPNIGIYFKLHIIPHLRKNFDFLQKLGISSTALKWVGLNCNSLKHRLKVDAELLAINSRDIKVLISNLYDYVTFEYREVERGLMDEGSYSLCQEFRDKFSEPRVVWGALDKKAREKLFLDFLGEVKRKKGNGNENVLTYDGGQSEILDFVDEHEVIFSVVDEELVSGKRKHTSYISSEKQMKW